MKDIHDIRPPVFVGLDPGILDILLIVLGIIAVVLLIWFLVRLYKKRAFRKKNKNTLLLPPPLPANEIALRELDMITDLMENERRLFYFKLTAIFKKYISKQFNTNAQEMTSQELKKSISKLNIQSDLSLKISIFLEFSDNIKYAAMPASTQEVEKDLTLIKKFVTLTSIEQEEAN